MNDNYVKKEMIGILSPKIDYSNNLLNAISMCSRGEKRRSRTWLKVNNKEYIIINFKDKNIDRGKRFSKVLVDYNGFNTLSINKEYIDRLICSRLLIRRANIIDSNSYIKDMKKILKENQEDN